MSIILNLVRKYWISSTLFILLIITVLSLRPLAALPAVPGTDKTHHFVAYATLMLPTALRKPKYWFLIALVFVGCSGAIELVQPYVNRYGEVEDMVANVAGLGCGLLIAEAIDRFAVNSRQK